MASRNVKHKDILIKKYELVHEIKKKKKKKPDQVRLCHFKKLEDEDFPFLPLVLSGCQAGTLSHNTHMITHTHTRGVNIMNAAQTTTSKLIIIFQGRYNSRT